MCKKRHGINEHERLPNTRLRHRLKSLHLYIVFLLISTILIVFDILHKLNE